MKLVSFNYQRQNSWGILNDHGVVDIGRRWEADLGRVLHDRGIDEVMTRCRQIAVQVDSDADLSSEQIRYLPPIPRPSKIICIGVNYHNRHQEYRDNQAAPKYPSVFMRTPESFVGNNEDLVRPVESEQLDYEGEIALVIGKRMHRIEQRNAMSGVWGYTLMNEGTIRDWVRHAKFNVTQGKNFPATGAIGPCLVTADEIDQDAWRRMELTTRVNGELRQNDTTDNLMFPFDAIISYLSIFMTLLPGDIIATGTPNGSGARQDPPVYLKPGDKIEVRVKELGVLSNGVRQSDDRPIPIPSSRF